MQSAQQLPANQQVKVSLLLTGGHQYTLNLKADDPVLRRLVNTIISDAQGNETKVQGLFQIPIAQNRASLCFPSNRLVGIGTEPPIIVEMGNELVQVQPHPARPTVPAQPVDLTAKCFQIDDFLSPEVHQRLIEHAVAEAAAFSATTTMTQTDEYRRSKVRFNFPEFADLVRAQIGDRLSAVLSALKLEPFPLHHIEAQLTAHNDGDYYKLHNDGGGKPETKTRMLTYVYYFYREPKPFGGGELVIYDTKLENNRFVKAGDTYKIVEPRNNSVVFFPSRCLHEVLPIHCPSEAFADSRFTINGWLHRPS
ncbi:MAG: 2OG-Fe(II) oxygenase [Cyanobacteria bacterium P01_F01_bin.86]